MIFDGTPIGNIQKKGMKGFVDQMLPYFAINFKLIFYNFKGYRALRAGQIVIGLNVIK